MRVFTEQKEYYSNESSSDESSSDESSSYEFTSLIPVSNKFVRQNPNNGYVSVNDITKGTGKYWCGYKNKKSTKKFIKEVEITTKIPKKNLITEKSNQDRWVHPYIAIHFCQWVCPKLSVEISKFVYNFISGSFVPSEFTQYIQTISDNKNLKKELTDIKSKKSSFEHENENLKRKLKSFKNIIVNKNHIKIKNSKKYDLSLIDNDILVLTLK